MNAHSEQENLNNLLKEIILSTTTESPIKTDVFNAEKYCEQFSKIYGKGLFRHSYAAIADLLYGTDVESLDILMFKMMEILTEVKRKEVDEPKSKKWANTGKALNKLKDHIELEHIHIDRLRGDSLRRDFNEAVICIREVEQKTAITEENLKKAKKDIDGFNAQSITVLGIFAGIVMAFTGAFSLLGSAFSQINAVSFYRLLFLVLLVGFVLINSIFILIYMVGKLVNKSVASNCKYSTPSPAVSSLNFRNICECDPEQRKKCNPLKKFYRRYPFVSILDAVILCMIALLAIMRFIWK
ncbi:hypothetical protein AALG83_02300 [Christensenellaceae bacterium 44-20]